MAKVRIKRLPDGYSIVEGKVKKTMQTGGSTGDQFDFGLVTTIPTEGKINKTQEKDVRYSLSAVPKDEANIEAEGGETVLTDLNNDGQFGLYDIKGPRHSKGGVPLNLPEQSFVFSDTPALKFKKNEMQEFDINSKKKKTPAAISKKYDLNPFYAAIRDEFADDIQVKSADLMLEKNKKSLSKLAFAQESKKNFSDGVPVASYPYLMSQGIDPIQFTKQVEQISMQKAQQKAFDALPPDKQQQILALQEAMKAIDEVKQNPPERQMQTAKYGKELPKAQQFGEVEYTYDDDGNIVVIPSVTKPVSNNQPVEENEPNIITLSEDELDNIPTSEPLKEKPSVKTKPGLKRRSNNNIAIDPSTVESWRKRGINLATETFPQLEYSDVQRESDAKGRYAGASKNEELWLNNWKGVYPDAEKLIESLDTFGFGENPEVKNFQNWINNTYIPSVVNNINEERASKGLEPLTEQQAFDLTADLKQDYGFGEGTGRALDGKFGTYTSTRSPLKYDLLEPEVVQEKEGEPLKVPEIGKFDKLGKKPTADWWLQDLIQLGAIANRKREMFMPWQPEVPMVEPEYVLEDPTRAIAAINEASNITNQALGTFGGPQSFLARASQVEGKAVENIANTLANVNQRNVSTVNQGLAMKAQAEMLQGQESRERKTKQYDDTQKVLQMYMDEKNFDREQYAQALSNAITNRANTYNLNSIQDYYKIDPRSGGMIGQFGSKAFEPAPPQDPYAFIDDYADVAKRLKAAGIEPNSDLMNNIFQMSGSSTEQPQETNVQREFKSMYQGYPGTGYTQQPQAKKGKEIKKSFAPFFIGKVGM